MSERDERTGSSAVGFSERPVNMNGVPAQPSPMTYEQFMEWADEDTHAEWVDGEIEIPSPASRNHQDIKGFLEATMRSYIGMKDLGIIYSAGFQMKLPTSGREPDIVYLKKANLDRLRNTFIDGPADLAVEIVSPESFVRDTQVKFNMYAAGGVREYWLINPMTQTAEFYQLDDNGQYRQVQPVNGVYASRELAGFWIRVDWLWQPPQPETALLAIGGQDYARFLLQQIRQAGFDVTDNPSKE